jgi:hypothetical protein
MNRTQYQKAMDKIRPDPYMKVRMAANLAAQPTARHSRRPARAALAVALAAALTITAGAAYVATHWGDLLERHYQPTDDQKALLADAMTDVNVSVEADGCTFTVTQLMGDEHAMCVALEITLPEDVDLTGTTATTAELQAAAEAGGYDWDDAVRRLNSFDYDETGDDFAGGVQLRHFDIYPTTADDPQAMADYVAERVAETADTLGDSAAYSATHMYLFSKAYTESDGVFSGSSSRRIAYDFDPETRTLSLLLLVSYDASPQGLDCTLLLDGLTVQNIPEALAAGPDADLTETNLLSEPVLLSFKATYTPYSKTYAIYEGDRQVGTVDLSPILAYVEFPMDADTNTYDSLEEAAQGRSDGNHFREDHGSYVVTLLHPEIVLTDGTVIALQDTGGGMADTNWEEYLPETLFDLDDVAEFVLEGYNVVPLE